MANYSTFVAYGPLLNFAFLETPEGRLMARGHLL